MRSEQLKGIHCELAMELTIRKSPGRHSSSKYISLQVKDYPNFSFLLTGNSYRASKREKMVHEVKVGDHIELDILLEDYQEKIAKSKALSFFDKSVNYHTIPVYGLRKGNTSYLNLRDYNRENKKVEHTIAFWLFFLISLALIFFGSKMWRESKTSLAVLRK